MEEYLDPASLTFAINHTFLPPKLPQKDDLHPEYELALLRAIIGALTKFESVISDTEKVIVRSLREILKNAQSVFITSQPKEGIQEDKLHTMFTLLTEKKTVLPLHIQAQNAGIIMIRTEDRIRFEAFELSPHNEAVMATKGRLRRAFPGSVVSVSLEVFKQEEVRHTIARTLVKMSHQSAAGTRPRVEKSKQMHEEDRDTVHPKLVTELFEGFLRAIGQLETVSRLWKNTRDDVLWSASLAPSRRSPFWLLIRVTLQLLLARRFPQHLTETNLYKRFMIFFLGMLLNMACDHSFPPDILHIMNTKIARRALKLNMKSETPEFAYVRRVAERAAHLQQSTWTKIIGQSSVLDYRPLLQRLNLEEDLEHRLPDLDRYLAAVATWQNRTSGIEFVPTSTQSKYLPSQLPSEVDSSIYNLIAFEEWIASHLSQWLKVHLRQDDTCGKIREILVIYHTVAKATYKDDPEATSRMILVIFELWIACDTSARERCSLLNEYDPGFPFELLQCLLVPTKQMMQRLQCVESYLLSRHKRASSHKGSIFFDFGTSDCFAVRYFQSSIEHQNLLAQIQQHAQKERQSKEAEYKRKKEEYTELMRLYDQGKCQYTKVMDTEFGPREEHEPSCQRCRRRGNANALDISIHEWPLPDDQMASRNVVFELLVPNFFGHWREACMYVIRDVVCSRHVSLQNPVARHTLKAFQGLKNLFRPFDGSQTIGLLSEVKPHGITHRRAKKVGHATLQDICLNNGLQYRYFDEQKDVFVTHLGTTDELQEICTYTLTKQSACLQVYLARPPWRPSGPSPNTVIAQQADCPNHLSLPEFKALTSLPLGFRLVWMNVLVQLSMPTVDFKKEETAIFVLQSILQAGPRLENETFRATHACLCTESFGITLVRELKTATGRIQKNWDSMLALDTFVSLAVRLLAVTSSEQVSHECIFFLTSTRMIALGWLDALQDKRAEEVNDLARSEFHLKAAEAALICAHTFLVDDRHLKTLLQCESNASIFIRCCIVVHDSKHVLSKESSHIIRRLYRLWQELTYRAYPILSHAIIEEESLCLNNALVSVWQAYKSYGSWQRCPGETDHWLVMQQASGSDEQKCVAHYDLLSGKLLVNGQPLDRLPSRYECHPMYHTLFGRAIIEVMPSQRRGMEFSAKRAYAEHSLDLGMDGKTLRIHATAGDKQYLLVPRDLLKGHFPDTFVEDHVHWYDTHEDELEFRPVLKPWTTTANLWRLSRFGIGWRLRNGDAALVSLDSQSSKVLCSLVASLDHCNHVHITYKLSTQSIELDVPRLQLGFSFAAPRNFVHSRQFRGLYIDPDQSLGTLIGLQDKLLLRHADGSRVVLLPEGDVAFRKHGQHVRVSVDKNSMSRFHAYPVDPMLGRLIDNGSLQSKLYLCYMHALTSFCLRDPLTHRTGTEQAISILTSSAVLSNDLLNGENIKILQHIAKLTPGRKYYPAHERVMQQISWNENINVLSQHGYYYRCVETILENAKKASVLSSSTEEKFPDISHVEPQLLTRDDIRSSCWRKVDTGSEAHTVTLDVVYSPRDQGQSSTQAKNGFITSRLIYSPQTSINHHPSQDILTRLWNFLAGSSKILGHQESGPSSELNYDAEWLLNPAESLRQHWCFLHRCWQALQSDKLNIAIWLSTIAFSGKVDMQLIQIVILLLTNHQMQLIHPPTADCFELGKGFSIDKSSLSEAFRKALRKFSRSPESSLVRSPNESNSAFQQRQSRQFNKSRDRTVNSFIAALQKQWPFRIPSNTNTTEYDPYLDVPAALRIAKPLFATWYDNHLFRCYLQQIVGVVAQLQVRPFRLVGQTLISTAPIVVRKHTYVSVREMFATAEAPSLPTSPSQIQLAFRECETRNQGDRLAQLLDQIEASAVTRFEHKYVDDLKTSLCNLQSRISKDRLLESIDLGVLQAYHEKCATYVDKVYAEICCSLEPKFGSILIAAIAAQLPRVSPIMLLQQLSRRHWNELSVTWRQCIVQYALALTMLQQANRLRRMTDSSVEFCQELLNMGHTNWDPMEHPESLLLEVEHGLLIRPAQQQVAREMATPSQTHNGVMQLNMGEGKSSVIVPMVTASLADGSRLVRVIVTKPQAKQMFHTLTTKLGGLLAHRIYRLPFSRDLKPDTSEIALIRQMCKECMDHGGVLLLQPEHILSMKLSGIDHMISGEHSIGQSLLSMQKFFDSSTRDIIDESDENFSVKFELVYTVGSQQPVEMSPSRWLYVQQVLDLIKFFTPTIAAKTSHSIELHGSGVGIFPRIRIIRVEAWSQIARMVVEHICSVGLVGFPVARLPGTVRKAIARYILETDPSPQDIAAIEDPQIGSARGNIFRSTLLLLRGLFAGGVLLFALSQKRWRVNYGLTNTRSPPTQLAVPYRAKDDPALRAEFSHPDVVILLTCLSHYYTGLQDDDLFLALSHLLKSDQADIEYQEWVKDAPDLSSGFRHVTGINLKDSTQCAHHIYPALRRTKKVIDYFLAQILFPKQLKSFPYKLSASGWDIGQVQQNPTTGFSGTNDSRVLLPLDVSYLDLPEQRYTNALVLEHLLQPENSVFLMPTILEASRNSSEILLSMIAKLSPPVRVILDVGAQILELNNIEVAREWLRLVPDCQGTEAVVFFGDDDELYVIDRRDRVESLQTSPFAEHLGLCLVFLDEAHTRGTDLRLPSDYRAAVTLGPQITKDKLSQACMRMRKLGRGQTVVFCVPEEIQTKILARCSQIDLSSIVRWAISETCNDLQASIPLWAVQGRRYLRQHGLWPRLLVGGTNDLSDHAQKFLEDESPSLEQRYQPGRSSQYMQVADDTDSRMSQIRQRCLEFEEVPETSATLYEEQERELSPEIERQQQVQHPPRAETASHHLHPDLIRLVTSGELIPMSSAWQPAFRTLDRTNAGNLLDLSQFSKNLLVTADFARTVQAPGAGGKLDDYQRPVQWILTGCQNKGAQVEVQQLIVISPYEAQEILPKVLQSNYVSLHVYAPRINFGLNSLDDLNLYSVSKRSFTHTVSNKAKILLNLFAGQLYFQSFDEYCRVCDFLGLAWTKTEDGCVVAADGFILSYPNQDQKSQMKSSPIAFLKSLMGIIRHRGEAIEKTHVGKVLNGGLLDQDDFGA